MWWTVVILDTRKQAVGRAWTENKRKLSSLYWERSQEGAKTCGISTSLYIDNVLSVIIDFLGVRVACILPTRHKKERKDSGLTNHIEILITAYNGFA